MAEINRATFYKHYLDVYDLLKKIEGQFLEELREVMISNENRTVKDVLVYIMDKFKQEEERYKAICSSNCDPTFPTKLFEICYDIAMAQKDVYPVSMSELKKSQTYQFIAHGCNGVIKHWIADGMNESPLEVADFTERLIKNTLSDLK
ncbi:MAG: TetR family transcriptional regulator C-terminal domain-containing protein [Firmicutes bacterium]|nr:TetR family transcriptional regulator C-terminal domain-containing protein [Bacillota bacterium]